MARVDTSCSKSVHGDKQIAIPKIVDRYVIKLSIDYNKVGSFK